MKCHIDTVTLQAALLQDFALIQLQCVFEPDLFKKNHVCQLALACWQVDFEHVTVQIIAARDCNICPVHLMLEAFKWKGSFPCHLYPYLEFNARP